jgi:CheY-like chemotaxis protein
MPSEILAVMTDLFFTVKLMDAAKRTGLAVKCVKSINSAVERAGDGTALVVVDLNCREVDSIEVIRRFKSDPALARIPMLGFLSHVQVDKHQEALQAGCDRVVPRSVFSDRAGELISDLASVS